MSLKSYMLFVPVILSVRKSRLTREEYILALKETKQSWYVLGARVRLCPGSESWRHHLYIMADEPWRYGSMTQGGSDALKDFQLTLKTQNLRIW